MKKLRQAIDTLTKADAVFWLMPPLMILLIAGTVSQKWIGLFRSIELFFSSFIIWAGPVPLPGGFTLLGLLTLSLTLKFLLKSDWSWRKSGIIITHLGALILLIGGLITAITAKESYMLIPEGSETPYIYHYTNRNLDVFAGETRIQSIPYEDIQDGKLNLPFEAKLTFTCNNCEIVEREQSARSYQSMAQFMQLKDKPEELEPEANLTGIEFEISGTENDGVYIAFDGMPKPLEIIYKDTPYTLIFGKAQAVLPFSIKLIDFVKEEYGGTEMAKAYSSKVMVKDDGLEWPFLIEMNAPLRYKGYTFFQSSYEQTEQIEMTILAVVENKGWLFPYIGTLVIAIGLMLHLWIILWRRTA